jgi:hypothetical protein
MSRHDPSNTNCDRVRYADADPGEVLCTCDDDTPAPSVSMPQHFTPGQVARLLHDGDVLLSGRRAVAYVRLESAVRDLEAAKQMLAPAEAEWRAALDALHAEILRP